MSKENDKNRKDEEDPELDEEQDEEEEDEEEDEEEEGEDEDEEEEEPSKASSKAASADDAEEEDEEDDEEEDEEDDEEEDAHGDGAGGHEADGDDEDPYWWTPHVVLGVIVLVGILGFFGMFNKPLAFLAAKPAGGQAQEAPKTETATPPQPATPPRPLPRPDQAQQQREMFGAKHLLVMYKGGMRAPPNVTRTKEEAKARAEEALKKIKAGTKFEDAVTEYSDEPGAGARGGDLKTFPKGAMVPQFQEGLEKTKVGAVSDLVETPFGYHVILRTQ